MSNSQAPGVWVKWLSLGLSGPGTTQHSWWTLAPR